MDPYDVLGVAPSASAEQVEAAYRRQLRAWHPDLHQADGPEAVAAAEARTRDLNEAMALVRSGSRPGAPGRPGAWSTQPPGRQGPDPDAGAVWGTGPIAHGVSRTLDALGRLRYVPTWMAFTITLGLLLVVPLVLFPPVMTFLALVLWAQTSKRFSVRGRRR